MREHITLYLNLAEKLSNDSAMEGHLGDLVADFPPLTRTFLDDLVQEAEREVLARPRLGWAIMAVADAAAAQQPDRFLQAKAAWLAAWAANEWVHPQRVAAALNRAETLFTESGDKGWLAACQWQRNALPWTQQNFIQVRLELEAALNGLALQPDTKPFVPHCELTLAYTLLLIGLHAAALELVQTCEARFVAQGDRLNQARCWFVKSACLRRMDRFDQAIGYTQQALDCFETLEAQVDVARTKCQLGITLWQEKAQYATAEQTLQEALHLFEILDIPLWVVQVKNALVQLFNVTGQFTQIGSYSDEVRAFHKEQGYKSLLADATYDVIRYEIAQGNYETALRLAKEAQHLYEQTGASVLQAAMINAQGAILLKSGRYEPALALLEEGYRRLQTLNVPGRLANCEINLAKTWLDLGQPERAHPYLNQARQHIEEAHQASLYGYVTVSQAEALIREQNIEAAIELLENGLITIKGYGNQLEIAAVQRRLGEVLCVQNRLDEAETQLRLAEQAFQQMGILFEQAACYLVWGRYYEKRGDSAAAQSAWHKALVISNGIMPDIEWQAQAGLAQLAEQQGNTNQAITHYQAALSQLAHIRGGLTQSTISSSFFNQSESIVDKAIHLAVDTENHTLALHFIETSKAVALAQQLHIETRTLAELPHVYDKQLASLSAEIRGLQEMLQTPFGRKPLPFTETRRLYKQLAGKVKAYDELLRELENMAHVERLGPLPTRGFDQIRFQQLAVNALGNDWLALDFYLTDTDVYGVALTATWCRSWQTRISPRARLALDMVKKPRADHVGFSEDDYKWLADLLLPDWVCALLHPDLTLLIAPHGDLHRLPWPALWLEAAHVPLINRCVPVIVPSLNSLIVLWQRTRPQPSRSDKGLLVAVAEFGDRHIPLPAVIEEAEVVIQQMNGGVVDYCNAAATWPNLQQAADDQGLQVYAWLHIASHAFYDGITGRLSGLALYDRDIWVDELKHLAPLPPLVILSVCSGNRGRIFSGDEQVGLTSTCLIAGAQTVISSLWPVLDKTGPQLFLDFYRHVAEGKGIALALASAQRKAWKQGVHVNHWSSFCCTGQP